MFNEHTPNDPNGDIATVLRLQADTKDVCVLEAKRMASITALYNSCLAVWGDHEIAWRQTIAELRCAAVLTHGQARREVDLACSLSQRLPAALQSMREGSVNKARATIIVDETLHLPRSDATTICNTVLEKAAQLTTRQLRDWIRRLCVTTNPDDTVERYKAEHADRAVSIELTSQGTATLIATGLEPGRAMATFNKLRHIAIAAKTKRDPRSHANLRADAFLDLLEGKAPSKKTKSGVHITVDLTTLMELDHSAIDIQGLGPIAAELGRQAIKAGATQKGSQWTYAIQDHKGKTVTGVTRRRPTAATKREVLARDRNCIFPGCIQPSVDCDLDHRVRYADGGSSHTDQLVPLCRPDHVDRHRGWEHIQDRFGNHMWISPTGMTYTTTRAP